MLGLHFLNNSFVTFFGQYGIVLYMLGSTLIGIDLCVPILIGEINSIKINQRTTRDNRTQCSVGLISMHGYQLVFAFCEMKCLVDCSYSCALSDIASYTYI